MKIHINIILLFLEETFKCCWKAGFAHRGFRTNIVSKREVQLIKVDKLKSATTCKMNKKYKFVMIIFYEISFNFWATL